MIMRINKIRIFYIVLFIAISNTPLVYVPIELFCFQSVPYRYSNADGTYTREYYHVFGSQTWPDQYLPVHGNKIVGDDPFGKQLRRDYANADTVVYRLFWKNPLCFWRWYAYLTNGMESVNFPYKSWDEIKKRRPKNFKRMEKWQDF
jgi:hypothetical protein